MRLLLLLLALLANPGITAYWTGKDSATVSWEQAQRSCLYHETAGGTQTFVGCWDKPGVYHIQFGRVGPLSGDLRPKAHDVYVLVQGDHVYRTPLVGRPQYVAIVLR